MVSDKTTRIFTTPTQGPLAGDLLLYQALSATALSGLYTLYYGHSGRIPKSTLRLSQRTADLVKIKTSLYGARGMNSSFMRGSLPESEGWTVGQMISTPIRMTEYVTGGPGMYTWAQYRQDIDPESFYTRGFLELEARPFKTGLRFVEDWAKGPAHATTFDYRDLWGSSPIRCDACISGNYVNLMTYSGGDTERAHIPYPDYLDGVPQVTWSLGADGKTISTGSDFLGKDGAVLIPASAKVITATQTLRRAAPFTTITRTTTSWRIPRAAATKLPSGYLCMSSPCKALPMLVTAYDLPVDLRGKLAKGTRRLVVDVHQNGALTPKGITAVTVKVNYGSGWVTAPVTSLGRGKYAATLKVPARSGSRTAADLSVTATASSGSTVTDQITKAFLLK